jgi:hypothetical protein
MAGVKLKNLYEGEMEVGDVQEITLSSHTLSAGVYFCRLETADGRKQMLKLVITQ